MNTRKDYERAATIVRNEFSNKRQTKAEEHSFMFVREAFVIFFTGDNPLFDSQRFRKACWPEGWKAS